MNEKYSLYHHYRMYLWKSLHYHENNFFLNKFNFINQVVKNVVPSVIMLLYCTEYAILWISIIIIKYEICCKLNLYNTFIYIENKSL